MAATVGTEFNTSQRTIQARNTQQDNALISGIKAIGRCIASFFQYLWNNCCCCIPCGDRQSRVLEDVEPVMPGPGGAGSVREEDVTRGTSEAAESEDSDPVSLPSEPPRVPADRGSRFSAPPRVPADRGSRFAAPPPPLRYSFLSDQRRGLDETTSRLLQATEHLVESDRLVAFARDALRNPEAARSRQEELETILGDDNRARANGLYGAIIDGRDYIIRNHARQLLEPLAQSVGLDDEEEFDDEASETSSMRTVIHRPSRWPGRTEPRVRGAEGYTPPSWAVPPGIREMTDVEEPVSTGVDRIRESDRRLDASQALIQFVRAIARDHWGERTDYLFQRTGLRQNATDQAIEQVLPQQGPAPYDMVSNRVRELVNTYEQGRGRRRADRDLDTMLIAALVISDYVGAGSRSTSVTSSRRSSLSESHIEDSPLTGDEGEDTVPPESHAWQGARPRTVIPPREPVSGSREDYTTNGVYLGAMHMPPHELARLASTRGGGSESVLRTMGRVSGDREPRVVRLAELLIREEYEEAEAFCNTNPYGDAAYVRLRREFYIRGDRHEARRLALLTTMRPERGRRRDDDTTMPGDESSSPYASLRESYYRNPLTTEAFETEVGVTTFLASRSARARAAEERNMSLESGGDTDSAAEATDDTPPTPPPLCGACFTDPGIVPWPCCSTRETPVAYCEECVDGAIFARLDDNNFDDYIAHNETVACPNGECRQRVTIENYTQHLKPATLERLAGFGLRVMAEGAGMYAVKCPDCSNGVLVDETEFTQPYFECRERERHNDNQNRRVCVRCSHIWEGRRHECPQSREGVMENLIRTLQMAIDDPDNIKLCPNERCEKMINRPSGCNHMDCAMCQRAFCWVCLRDWRTCFNSPGGGHFHCPFITEAEARTQRVGEYRRRLDQVLIEYRNLTGHDYVAPSDTAGAGN